MSEQQIFVENGDYSSLKSFFINSNFNKILLVCGHSIECLQINRFLIDLEKKNKIKFVRFGDFQPNPQYESVVKGIEVYRNETCEAILAVGGGSAMDVAKCIKLFSNMDTTESYLKQQIIPNDIKLIAVPTTSGTGSEATRFAVIYYNGEKQSISDYSCIPSIVVLDESTLESLPDYQRKVTLLDALCHAIESFWSVNATEESKGYSKSAIQKILKYMDAYLANDVEGNRGMLKASNIAGKAINITQTTAGHAMCYKLTSLYGIAHGHAAALCLSKLWPYMIAHVDKCIDPRGKAYVEATFADLAASFDSSDSLGAIGKFNAIIERFQLSTPKASSEEFAVLKKSVNPTRLKNNPIELDETTIDELYHKILISEEQ